MDVLASLVAKEHDDDALRLASKDWTWMANDSWVLINIITFLFVSSHY